MLSTVAKHAVENRQRGRKEGVEACLRFLTNLAAKTKDKEAKDLVERMEKAMRKEMDRRGWLVVPLVEVKPKDSGKLLELKIGDRVAQVALEEDEVERLGDVT